MIGEVENTEEETTEEETTAVETGEGEETPGETKPGEGKEEGKEEGKKEEDAAAVAAKEKVDAAEKRAADAETRAAHAEGRLAEKDRRSELTEEQRKENFDADMEKDPAGTIRRAAEDAAYDARAYEQTKADAVETFADDNPELRKHERAIKRKLRNFYPKTHEELNSRVELEYLAAEGRGTKGKVTAAQTKADEDAAKQKKILAAGTGTGTTVGKGAKTGLTAQEKTYGSQMGVTAKRLQETSDRQDSGDLSVE